MNPGVLVKARLLVALLGAFVAASAHAHHSFAMFDSENQVKLTGKVKEFHWQNPHVYIDLEAAAQGRARAATWTIECANPGILNRIGWKFNMIKEGRRDHRRSSRHCAPVNPARCSSRSSCPTAACSAMAARPARPTSQ